MKEDKASWQSFFKWLKRRGLEGVRLVVGDKCLGMLEAVSEVYRSGGTVKFADVRERLEPSRMENQR